MEAYVAILAAYATVLVAKATKVLTIILCTLRAVHAILRAIETILRVAHLTVCATEVRLASVGTIQVAEALSATEVTTVEAITHAHARLTTRARTAEGATVVPASSTIHSPAMTTMVRSVEVRATEVEVVAVRIAGVDSEVPVTTVPVERAIEVSGVQE